jgi:carbamoyltransferase
VILGITTTHGAGTCLLDLDGRLVWSAAEERLARHKNEPGLPHRMLEAVRRQVRPDDIAHVAIGSSYHALPERMLPAFLLGSAEKTRRFKNPVALLGYFLAPLRTGRGTASQAFRRDLFARLLRGHGISIGSDRVHFVDHHLAHAASAFYTSEFESPLVVTLDGLGDDKSGSVSLVETGGLRCRHAIGWSGSAGHLYFFATSALGFMSGRHEGKVVGLAGFGNPLPLGEQIGRYFFLEEDGPDLTFRNSLKAERENLWLRYAPRWPLEWARWVVRQEDFDELSRRFNSLVSRGVFRKLFGDGHSREDIAAGVQWLLEDRVTRFVQHYLRRHGKRELALAGGVFANVKLNQRLFNLPEVDRIFIHPGMGDEGLALGAAYQVLAEVNPGFKRQPLRDVYLGPAYSEAEVARALVGAGVKYRRVEDETALAEEAAARIAAGQVLGLFRGRMEYGPRALGARSVLADPRRREMHDTLNRKLRRSEFMPFAPVIPSERAYELLDGKVKGSEHAAEFMTLTYAVHPAWRARIPAVVHVDGTARPQLLRREVNPFYYAILAAFERRTGVPVLINTSFNLHEEPIVCSPQDALRAFAQGGVDAMVMERYVVER